MGRRKISIAPISDDRNRSVTFLKRKNGLFKKAFELGILCSADVAVIVFSNQGKLFEFHSGDMDQILLRYSHYNGPSHEKRGPSDYASKDVDEIAKLGLGGKMTTLEEAAAQAAADNDDDEIDDDDEDEEEAKPTPPPKSKKRKVSGGAKPTGSRAARPSASVEPQLPSQSQPQPSVSSPDEYDAARNLVAAAQQAQPQQQQPQSTQIPAAYANPGQNPFQAYGGFPGMLPPGMVAPGAQWGGYPQQPRMGQPGQMHQGMMSGGMPPPHMGGMSQAPWMMQPGQPIGGMGGFMHHSQAPPWISQPTSQGAFPGMPGGGGPGIPMGFMGQPAPGFEALHAAYQQSQPGQGGAGMYAPGGTPGSQMGYDPGLHSAPPSQQGTPMPLQQGVMDHPVATSRPASVVGGRAGGSRASSVAPRRGDSGSLKPRLSVSIPGGGTPDDQRQRGQRGAPILDPSGSQQAHQFTDEPEGIDDDARPPRADQPTSARFAADLLPSPSTFLADYSVNAGPGPHGYSLAGLNTAIAMANEDSRSVFSWPKVAGAGGGPREGEEGAEGWFGKEPGEGRRRSGAGQEEGEEGTARRR